MSSVVLVMILASYFGMQEWDLLQLPRLRFFLLCLSVYYALAICATTLSFFRYWYLIIIGIWEFYFFSHHGCFSYMTPLSFLWCKFCVVELDCYCLFFSHVFAFDVWFDSDILAVTLAGWESSWCWSSLCWLEPSWCKFHSDRVLISFKLCILKWSLRTLHCGIYHDLCTVVTWHFHLPKFIMKFFGLFEFALLLFQICWCYCSHVWSP